MKQCLHTASLPADIGGSQRASRLHHTYVRDEPNQEKTEKLGRTCKLHTEGLSYRGRGGDLQPALLTSTPAYSGRETQFQVPAQLIDIVNL